MCTICLDYKRGALTHKEAMINLAEMIAVASEDDHDMFTHLEQVEQMLIDEEMFNDNRETD